MALLGRIRFCLQNASCYRCTYYALRGIFLLYSRYTSVPSTSSTAQCYAGWPTLEISDTLVLALQPHIRSCYGHSPAVVKQLMRRHLHSLVSFR